MTDYLLVHGAGQGAWTWGHVWGYLTAPVSHPPRLYSPRPANRVYPLDLPGHGADAGGDTGQVRIEECVNAVVRAVERENLSDLVMVGHGFSAPIVIQAAEELPNPPKRIVLVAGVIPPAQRSMASVMPQAVRSMFRLRYILSKLTGRELRIPKSVVNKLLCNGMDPMEIVHVVGKFGPIPTRAMTARIDLKRSEPPCPLTYVVLAQNKLLPPAQQRQMAQRAPGSDIAVAELDSCHLASLQRPRELADLLLSYS